MTGFFRQAVSLSVNAIFRAASFTLTFALTLGICPPLVAIGFDGEWFKGEQAKPTETETPS